MHTPAVPHVLRFGAFEADLHARELRRQGMQIKLQEQPFQILAFLLEHAGEIVTREQIRQRLWPTDTFVDVDNSVNAAVNRYAERLIRATSYPLIPRHRAVVSASLAKFKRYQREPRPLVSEKSALGSINSPRL